MKAPRAARAALGVLCASAAFVGLPAALAPATFFADFPFVSSWVALLPPYNEHLVTDVGGLYLGFAVVFGWAAWTLQPALARAASAGWLLTAGIHLVFHGLHLDRFGVLDAIAEIASLAALLALPLLVLWASAPSETGPPSVP